MEPYHNYDEYTTGYTGGEDYHHHRAYSWGAVVIVVIVIVVIIVLIWWFTRATPPAVIVPVNGGGTTSSASWIFVQGNAASSDTFTATNNTVYRAIGISGGTSLTLISPTLSVSGQQFVIDNTQGTGNITLTGVNVVSGAGTNVSQANVIPRGRSAWFIWQSASSILRMT